jgi:hypothetical protein
LFFQVTVVPILTVRVAGEKLAAPILIVLSEPPPGGGFIPSLDELDLLQDIMSNKEKMAAGKKYFLFIIFLYNYVD